MADSQLIWTPAPFPLTATPDLYWLPSMLQCLISLAVSNERIAMLNVEHTKKIYTKKLFMFIRALVPRLATEREVSMPATASQDICTALMANKSVINEPLNLLDSLPKMIRALNNDDLAAEFELSYERMPVSCPICLHADNNPVRHNILLVDMPHSATNFAAAIAAWPHILADYQCAACGFQGANVAQYVLKRALNIITVALPRYTAREFPAQFILPTRSGDRLYCLKAILLSNGPRTRWETRAICRRADSTEGADIWYLFEDDRAPVPIEFNITDYYENGYILFYEWQH